MCKHEKQLNDLLHLIEEKSGAGPDRVAEQFKLETREGMMREGVLQIISREKLLFRLKYLMAHPEMILPYFLRIKIKK